MALCRDLFRLALVIPALVYADDGGNAQAKQGVKLAGGLIQIGSVDLMTAIALPVPPEIKIPMILDALKEISGGDTALKNNQQTDAQTAIGAGGIPTVAANAVSSSASQPANYSDVCAANPQGCVCTADGVCTPSGTLPTLDSIKSDLKGYQGESTLTPGSTLDAALTTLDNAYRNAQKAISDSNKGGTGNGSGGGGGGTGGIASTVGNGVGIGDALSSDGGGNAGKKSDGESDDQAVAALGRVSGTDEGSGAGGHNDLSGILKSFTSKREPPVPSIKKGMNLISSLTGKTLTLFERCTRAIRGRNNRDLLLAKLEFVRRQFLHRNATPTQARGAQGKPRPANRVSALR